MRCLICQADTIDFLDSKMKTETYRCGHCGVIFKDPQTYQSLDLQKQRYDLHENHAEDAGYRSYFQQFLDFVLPQAGSCTTALDFGCGSSTLLAEMLTEKGIKATAYDPIYHPEVSYQERTYDLITSVEVFEHLHDPLAVLKRLAGLLSRDGILALRTAFVPATIEEYLDWYYRQDPTHVVFFSPETFKVMCGDAGMAYLGDNGKNIVLMGF